MNKISYKALGATVKYSLIALLLLDCGLIFMVEPLRAEKIANGVAVFAALDKVTARISHLEVKLDETAKFGALKVTPRVCYTRPPTEPPLTTAFVEVEEVKLNGEEQNLFSGWMFAQSPGLNAVQHPVFDVWLTNCKISSGDASADNPRKSDRTLSAPSNRP